MVSSVLSLKIQGKQTFVFGAVKKIQSFAIFHGDMLHYHDTITITYYNLTSR